MKKWTGKLAETWGLGASASALFALLVVTGGILMFYYRPVPELAWADVVDLREASWAGSLRKLHYWGAQLLVIVVWLHLLRVFLIGAHRPPHQGNWSVGVGLLALTLAMAASGHLLPWDQDAVSGWGLSHPTVDGSAPSPSAPSAEGLLWVYLAHCIVLPLLTTTLIVHHWRRYRRRREAAE